ncbi:MAG: hypothetical protein FJZ64_00125 [Chlamydiae bacterium]|nr:hypothetical protein [Chlamydiota bacterium]
MLNAIETPYCQAFIGTAPLLSLPLVGHVGLLKPKVQSSLLNAYLIEEWGVIDEDDECDDEDDEESYS